MTAAFNWSSEDVTRYFSNSLSHTMLDYNGIGIYYPMYVMILAHNIPLLYNFYFFDKRFFSERKYFLKSHEKFMKSLNVRSRMSFQDCGNGCEKISVNCFPTIRRSWTDDWISMTRWRIDRWKRIGVVSLVNYSPFRVALDHRRLQIIFSRRFASCFVPASRGHRSIGNYSFQPRIIRYSWEQIENNVTFREIKIYNRNKTMSNSWKG